MSKSPNAGYRSMGFTLVELMITIVIAMIILSITVPSFNQLIESSRVKTTQDLLTSAIQRAQQEAIRSGRSAYLCPSVDGTGCSSAWAADRGWLIFLDQDRDDNFTSSNDSIISVQTTIDAAEIEGSSVKLHFFPSGHVADVSGAAPSFSICSGSDNVDDRRFSINRVGRVDYVAAASHCS
ncbi:GspH/FimT family pseudopilin [Ferrimonas lipolytica]|uniref:Type II secretion system protein H n=1 Tax=Ferrimonas lipolytica TaxID=2724191 RepID=A0A6H1UEU8_9GAMM|nr:GspH/FimT family pseudopilin [Ferrimonas lipolytica]QIZ77120.1 hypothetical protein HER31_09680 [Ferrimonas lipolytica]